MDTIIILIFFVVAFILDKSKKEVEKSSKVKKATPEKEDIEIINIPKSNRTVVKKRNEPPVQSKLMTKKDNELHTLQKDMAHLIEATEQNIAEKKPKIIKQSAKIQRPSLSDQIEARHQSMTEKQSTIGKKETRAYSKRINSEEFYHALMSDQLIDELEVESIDNQSQSKKTAPSIDIKKAIIMHEILAKPKSLREE